jgi:hypothetical protein
MRKRRIKLLNDKYIIACHIRINKGTKVFCVPPKMSLRTPGGTRTPGWIPLLYWICGRKQNKQNRFLRYINAHQDQWRMKNRKVRVWKLCVPKWSTLAAHQAKSCGSHVNIQFRNQPLHYVSLETWHLNWTLAVKSIKMSDTDDGTWIACCSMLLCSTQDMAFVWRALTWARLLNFTGEFKIHEERMSRTILEPRTEVPWIDPSTSPSSCFLPSPPVI